MFHVKRDVDGLCSLWIERWTKLGASAAFHVKPRSRVFNTLCAQVVDSGVGVCAERDQRRCRAPLRTRAVGRLRVGEGPPIGGNSAGGATFHVKRMRVRKLQARGDGHRACGNSQAL